MSKSGTLVEVVMRDPEHAAISTHGSGQAQFHECEHCADVVLVSVNIESELYCAININCLAQRDRFPLFKDVNFSALSPEQKLDRWRQNWCRAVFPAKE